MSISVVVPTYNVESTRGTMRQCLESVVSQDAPADEIIVVDSSDDGTTDVIREFEPAVRLIHLPQPTFAGDALNLGVREASGEAIAFIDSDCVAERTWIKGIREGYAQNDGAVDAWFAAKRLVPRRANHIARIWHADAPLEV